LHELVPLLWELVGDGRVSLAGVRQKVVKKLRELAPGRNQAVGLTFFFEFL